MTLVLTLHPFGVHELELSSYTRQPVVTIAILILVNVWFDGLSKPTLRRLRNEPSVLDVLRGT